MCIEYPLLDVMHVHHLRLVLEAPVIKAVLHSEAGTAIFAEPYHTEGALNRSIAQSRLDSVFVPRCQLPDTWAMVCFNVYLEIHFCQKHIKSTCCA